MRRKTAVIGLVAASVLTGCTLGPNYQRPKLEVPEQYHGQLGPAEAASLADAMSAALDAHLHGDRAQAERACTWK